MKVTLKVDHENGRMMNRTFANLAANVFSEEYKILQGARQDYPTYVVVRRTIKKNPNRECYRGLTYDYNLITRGAPDDSFLWPQDLIFKGYGESFGYIMPLRPKNFKSIVDMMKRRAEPSFRTLCKAAYNLTNGYQKLHTMGYSYRDISFGNMFFDPDTGDVLICDNDNVSANGMDNSSVYGTPRFMAPEIVMGQAKPSWNTDLYKNADEFQKTCVDYFAMIQQYGADAVAANLKSWLSETSAMGCGDDITVLIAYFFDDTATESEAVANE